MSFWQRKCLRLFIEALSEHWMIPSTVLICKKIYGDTSAMVHIRLATVGVMSSINCHPFRHADYSGRIWTFMHNGTAFQDSMLEPYKHLCRGDTDSEAVFYFILDAINRAIKEKGRPLTKEERIPIIEERITHLVQGNKMNLIFYDTEQMYVHTNMKGTLF